MKKYYVVSLLTVLSVVELIVRNNIDYTFDLWVLYGLYKLFTVK